LPPLQEEKEEMPKLVFGCSTLEEHTSNTFEKNELFPFTESEIYQVPKLVLILTTDTRADMASNK